MEIFHVDILRLIFAGLAMWSILIVAEGLKRLGYVHGEYARKLIHISVGVFLAALPLFANRREIVLINISLLIGMIVLVGFFHLFSSIEDVPRWTLGHFLYPIGIIFVIVFFKDPIVYSFSVLVLALSDGFAAVVGKWHGKKYYHAIGGVKTYLGSLTFFLITLVLLLIFTFTQAELSATTLSMAVGGAAVLAGIEGSLGAGFDNLVIPFFAALVLQGISQI